MALIKFYRGELEHYKPDGVYQDAVYFAYDNKYIYVNGVRYGFNAEVEHLINNVTYDETTQEITLHYTDHTTSTCKLAEIIDNLESTDPYAALSANQGKVLDEKIDSTKEEIDNKIDETKAELEQDIADAKKELNTRITQVETNLTQKIDDAKQELTEDIQEAKTELNNKIDTTKQDLQEQIEETESTLNQTITTVKNELTQNITETKEELTQTINTTKEELQSQIEETATEASEALTQAKEEINNRIDSEVEDLNNRIENLGDVYNVKGSVKDKTALLAVSAVIPGDVYNVVAEVTINDNKYPAGTNFVYIGAADNQASVETNWDSLGGVVDLSEIDAMLDKLYKEVFPLNISVSGGGLYEKRTTQTVTVRWTVKEGSDVVVPDTVTVNDEPVTNTDTSKVFESVTTNTTYTVKAVKTGQTVQGNTSVTFVNPSYFGVVAADYSPAEDTIKALTKSVKSGRGYTGTATLNNQKTCYAYPKSMGALTSVKDANNFEYIGSYTRTELTVWDETYYVYVLTNPTTITNFKQIYS